MRRRDFIGIFGVFLGVCSVRADEKREDGRPKLTPEEVKSLSAWIRAEGKAIVFDGNLLQTLGVTNGGNSLAHQIQYEVNEVGVHVSMTVLKSRDLVVHYQQGRAVTIWVVSADSGKIINTVVGNEGRLESFAIVPVTEANSLSFLQIRDFFLKQEAACKEKNVTCK
jgi:hypothetical protein